MLFVFNRDSPVIQGNSILALSGLAAVLAKYESNLPTDGDSGLGVILKPSLLWFTLQHLFIVNPKCVSVHLL